MYVCNLYICTYLSHVYSATFTTQWCAGSNPEDSDLEYTSVRLEENYSTKISKSLQTCFGRFLFKADFC